MAKLFILIYDFFKTRRNLLHLSLLLLIGVMSFFSLKLEFVENVTSFFGKHNQESAKVFENFKSKDKLAIMLSIQGEQREDDLDYLVEQADSLALELKPLEGGGYVNKISSAINEEEMLQTVDFIYEHLPLLLKPSDYERLNNLINRDSISKIIHHNKELMTSPMGIGLSSILERDPLSIGTTFLKDLQRLGEGINYELYDNHIFNTDLTSLVFFLNPKTTLGNTGVNSTMIELLEAKLNKFSNEKPRLSISYFGAPAVAVYNAKQIKDDVLLTSSIALIIILLVMLGSFRNKWFIPLMLSPVVFALVFALSAIYFIQKEISAIAVGAGAAIVGIILSYAIHVIVHNSHTKDLRLVIKELAYPLTIGSFTTIGAFVALTFAESPLLHEFGLFASFALLGTILFCLIYLPHYLELSGPIRSGLLLKYIERFNHYKFHKNKFIIILLSLITIISLFFYDKVKLSSNLNEMNFMPSHLQKGEERLFELFGNDNKNIFLVSNGTTTEEALSNCDSLSKAIEGLKNEKLISNVANIRNFIISEEQQQKNLQQWQDFWFKENNLNKLKVLIQEASLSEGFSENAFEAFFTPIEENSYETIDYSNAELLKQVPLFTEWLNFDNKQRMIISRLSLSSEEKSKIYEYLQGIQGLTILDRGYYSSKMIDIVNHDFNYLFYVSSFLVFLVLLLSYGRLELALLSISPMVISWIIILGMMAIFGIEFNIVNVILSTFIFGMGDDFSIFIMDGLISEYKSGKATLSYHKTAIFFSAFTVVVGLGVLIFAQHPALKSIALISLLGMGIVLLVSYTLQPIIFRLFITKGTEKGGFPFTISSLLITSLAFTLFLLGCLFANICLLLCYLLPLPKAKKRLALHYILHYLSRIILYSIPFTKVRCLDKSKIDFSNPSMLIANHSSFIDILLALSLSPRVVLITNKWVWHSPFFGRVIRYIGCLCIEEGFEKLKERALAILKEGYSIFVFPEGTRSPNCQVQRFHKGSFLLAQELDINIQPIVIYGAGLVSSKEQGLYIKRGLIVMQCYNSQEDFGSTYQEQAKSYRRWFAQELDKLKAIYDLSNLYYTDCLKKNYIFKGCILEWYIRVKARLDGYYHLWHNMLDNDAKIVDVGCGYGQLSLMLALLAPKRSITAIDYDEDKIDVAKHIFSARQNLCFKQADIRTYQFEEADAFIFNDSLHYISVAEQKLVLTRCSERLSKGGKIIIREDYLDTQQLKKDKKPWQEFVSTKILNFNKTEDKLSFTPRTMVQTLCQELNLDLIKEEIHHSKTRNSILYVIQKNN